MYRSVGDLVRHRNFNFNLSSTMCHSFLPFLSLSSFATGCFPRGKEWGGARTGALVCQSLVLTIHALGTTHSDLPGFVSPAVKSMMYSSKD